MSSRRRRAKAISCRSATAPSAPPAKAASRSTKSRASRRNPEMPAFSFDARALDGRRVRGVENAASVAALDRALEERKLVLVRARVGGGRAGAHIPNSGRVLIDFCYHLATSIEAGVPLVT